MPKPRPFIVRIASLPISIASCVALTRAQAPFPAASTSSGAPSTGATQARGTDADGAKWTDLALPPDFNGSVTMLGTSGVLQTSSAVHLWSALRREWTVVPVSSGAGVLQFNDYVTIEDGNTLHGWATRTGVVDTLVLAAPPVVTIGSQSSNWVSIAVLGADAWGFAAFDGKWVHQSLASAAPTVSVTQLTGLVRDGATVYGFSGYHGSFVPLVPTGVPTIATNGDVGIARTPTEVYGFSAHTNTWSSHAFSSGSQLVHERGYALFADGPNVLAYSGCTGAFATQQMSGAPVSLTSGRYVAAVRVGNEVASYSAGVNAFDARIFAGPTVKASDEMLVVADAAGVTGFSCVKGAYSDPVAGAFASTVREATAWLAGAGAGYAYSPLTNQWSLCPYPNPSATVLRNAIVVTTSNGYFGFSGRNGDWTFHPSSSPTTALAPTSGDLFLGLEGPRVHAFDPLLSRWSSVTMQAPAVASDVWRQTAVLHDGSFAHGFSLMNHAWESHALEGAAQFLDANDACGAVLTSTHVHTYSGHGSLSTTSRWPEFSRIQPLAAALPLHQVAPPGTSVTRIASLSLAAQSLGALGLQLVDPSQLVSIEPAGVVPASGLLESELDLSRAARLGGLALHVQDLLVAPSGKAWLSSAVSPVLF